MNNVEIIDLTLEVSSGCNYGCSGCTVEKLDNSIPDKETADKLITLLDDLRDNGMETRNVSIGPTDILSSGNLFEIFSNKDLKKIVNGFMKLTLNCSFLEPNPDKYEMLAQLVEDFIPNGLLKFTVPFEVRHIDNLGYIERIYNRIKFFESKLKTVKITKVYSVVNFEESVARDKKRNFNLTTDIMNRVHEIKVFEHTHVDFILPHGRKTLRNNDNRTRFMDSILLLNEMMLEAKAKSLEEGGWFDIVEFSDTEGKDWDLVYRNGDLFMPPFVVEEFISFDEIHKVHVEWMYETLTQMRQDRLMENIYIASTNGICERCEFVAKCASRGVQAVMDLVDARECISVLSKQSDAFRY